jgi:hypothetical protein
LLAVSLDEYAPPYTGAALVNISDAGSAQGGFTLYAAGNVYTTNYQDGSPDGSGSVNEYRRALRPTDRGRHSAAGPLREFIELHPPMAESGPLLLTP